MPTKGPSGGTIEIGLTVSKMVNVAHGVGEVAEPPGKRQKLSPSSTNGEFKDGGLISDKPLQAYEATAFEHREAQLGILCYVNDTHVGFEGIFKQRYTDFCVNEVDLKGTVVHLTDVRLPGSKPQNKLRSDSSEALENADVTTFTENDGATADTPMPGKTDQDMVTNSEPPSEVTSLPSEPAAQIIQKPNPTPGDENAGSQAVSKPSYSHEDVTLLDSYFGITLRLSIMRLYEQVMLRPNAKVSSFGSIATQPITDRQLRTVIHQDMRRIFQNVLETASDGEGVIKISVAPRKNTSYGRGGSNKDFPRTQTKGKVGWQELGGQYLHFSLYKENKDTMEVINFISSRLKIRSKQFGIAGTKDRRAVTVQRVSIPRMRADQLGGLNKILNNARIGNFSYEKQGLQLGDLMGNEFQITLRNCLFHGLSNENAVEEDKLSFATAVISTAIGNLQRGGFINYYGLQRFGTNSVGTHEVGKLILKGDYKGAVDAILAYPKEAFTSSSDVKNGESNGKDLPRDDNARARAINVFETTANVKLALEMLPKKFSGELHVMKHLQRSKQDFLGALTMIPRNLKTIYVHAYQSLVWNMAASKRWERFGATVVKGDLIIDESAKSKSSTEMNMVDENGELVILPDAADMAVTSDDLFQRARPLTEEEAASGKYSIFDIVLPTPGYDINYPDNEIGDYYKEFMESERGGGLNPANMRRSHKDFSMSGSYRKLIEQIRNDVSFQVKLYSDEKEQFVQTDLEMIEMKSNTNHKRNSNQKTGGGAIDGQGESPLSNDNANSGQNKIAVIIKFQLASSVYATMALRELMKRGGAKAFKPEFSTTR